MKYATLVFSAIVALTGTQAFAQTNSLSTIAIGTAVTGGGTANGVVTLTPRIGIAGNVAGSVLNNLSGLQYVAGQAALSGAPASVAFFALSGSAIANGGGPAADFTSYGTLTTPTQVNTYADPASKLTPNSYSALTFASADLGFGPSNFYMIHHAPNSVDYFAAIVPGTGTATSIADLKPMSWPATGGVAGGPASPGTNGYFALAYAPGAVPGGPGGAYAANSMFYLRTDVSNNTQFGFLIPALTSASTDAVNLTNAVGSFGATGYTTLTYTPTVLSDFGADQFYYLRLDPITGNTILGRLNPSLSAGTRTISDIANLGGVYNTLVFAPDATGPAGAWGTNQFYVTGAPAAGSQSVSLEAIPNHNIGDIFTITPTASSGLDIAVTVVSGPATVLQTGTAGANPSTLIFTVTTTGPGVVTLQATQAGPGFTTNMLRQSFDVLGLPSITSATTAPGTVGTAFTFNIVATGSPTSYSAAGLPAGLTINTATGVISGTPTATGTLIVTLTATNPTGTSTPSSTLTITVASAAVTPVITSPTTAPGTVGTPIPPYTIGATGVPTSYTATGLPPGLTVNTSTGVISGTPTTPGTYVVTITATNSAGTSTSTITFTVASPTVTPVITSPLTASGALGTTFVTYIIAGTGLPTSYTAVGLPPGLTLNSSTGAINGTPMSYGTFAVTINATNSAGTSTATLTIVISSSRIMNFSARAMSGPGADSLIVGFVVNGNGKNILVRGIGPDLATFGITNFLANPILTLYSQTGVAIATDTGWSTTSAGVNDSVLMAATAAQVGAFALPAGSADSAILATVNFGASTSGLLTSNSSSGVGLIEIYDTGGNPFSSLINVSARMEVTSGNGMLIAGFIIGGNTTKSVLIRGVGPTLSTFGVTGVLADPQITVYSGATVVATNSSWGTGASTAAQLSAAFSLVGAFPLQSGSKDAAVLLTLAPGAYTVEVSSVSNSTGVALVEVYDMQQPL
jgi:PKD repeat protein